MSSTRFSPGFSANVCVPDAQTGLYRTAPEEFTAASDQRQSSSVEIRSRPRRFTVIDVAPAFGVNSWNMYAYFSGARSSGTRYQPGESAAGMSGEPVRYSYSAFSSAVVHKLARIRSRVLKSNIGQ